MNLITLGLYYLNILYIPNINNNCTACPNMPPTTVAATSSQSNTLPYCLSLYYAANPAPIAAKIVPHRPA